jgi:hypothetical protein
MINIDWTTVISSAVVAMIIGGFQLVGNRYTTRLLDRLEASVNKWRQNGKPNGTNG